MQYGRLGTFHVLELLPPPFDHEWLSTGFQDLGKKTQPELVIVVEQLVVWSFLKTEV